MKMEAERKADYEKGAPVDLMAIASKDERDNQMNLISARQSPGYLFVKELIADMVDRRSDRVILDFTQQAVVARQHIDGVWHNSEGRDRESGDVMLAVMKTLANLSASERRKKQESQVRREVQGAFVRVPDHEPGRADRRASRRAAAGRIPAQFQALRRPGHAAEAGRAVGRADVARQGAAGHCSTARGRSHDAHRHFAHGNGPAAARFRRDRRGEPSRARDREHRGHDLRCRPRAKRRLRYCRH